MSSPYSCQGLLVDAGPKREYNSYMFELRGGGRGGCLSDLCGDQAEPPATTQAICKAYGWGMLERTYIDQ